MKTKLILASLINFIIGFSLACIIDFNTGLNINPFVAGISIVALSMVVGKVATGNIAFSLITGTPITFSGEEAREAVIDPAFSLPEINMFHRVIPGITARKQVAFLPTINKITVTDAGCGTGVLSKTLTPTAKYWAPNKLKIWLQQCADDVEQTFFNWGLSKGIKRKDLGSTTFEDYMLSILPGGIMEDFQRLAWFGDVDADDYTGTGTLLNASDVPHYNQLNGFWTKIFAAVTGSTMKHVTIAANAQATFALQDSTLTGTNVKDIFKSMLTGDTDARLKATKNKMIICTTSMFEKWLDYKESQSIDRSFERQENGYETDIYRGVKIIAYDLWDRFLRADFQDGTAYHLPHRAVLIAGPDSLQIGVDTDNVSEMDIFHDKTTELHNIKGGYMADVQIPYDYMVVAAY